MRPTLLLVATLGLFAQLAAAGPAPLQPLPLKTSGERSLAPRLTAGSDGAMTLSWLETDAKGARLRYADWNGRQWRSPATVAQGQNWFVNWADTPAVLARGPERYAHMLVKRAAGTYHYDVQLWKAGRDGRFRALGAAHDDGVAAEHGFVSWLPLGDRQLLVWLDGRNTGGGGHDEHGHAGAMTLRSAELDAQGRLLEPREIDARVCDCCGTDLARVGNDALAIYRDRSEDDVRDIRIARYRDGQWQDLIRFEDNWQIKGCPVNGPRLISQQQQIMAAWFTAADDQPRVRFARSENAGASFSAPITLASGHVLGRIAMAALPKGQLAVGWLEQDDHDAVYQLQVLDAKNTPLQRHTLLRTTANRASGIPQLATQGDTLLFAWTEVEGKTTRVRSGKIAWR